VQESAKKIILVVDDEKGVRDLILGFLAAEPYHVVDVDSSRKAVEFAEHITVDLLVADAMLPNMKGRDLAARLGGLQPMMKVLFMSGYSADVLINHGIFPGQTRHRKGAAFQGQEHPPRRPAVGGGVQVPIIRQAASGLRYTEEPWTPPPAATSRLAR
jgi:CheY-like chemotaxis protein